LPGLWQPARPEVAFPPQAVGARGHLRSSVARAGSRSRAPAGYGGGR